jgi:cytochrome c biogenesis protein CcdA
MNDFENRLRRLEEQAGRYQRLIAVLVVVFAGFILFEVLAAKGEAPPVSDNLRTVKAGLVTAAMLGAFGLGLVVSRPFKDDFLVVYVFAGGAFLVGLAGATGIFLYEHANLVDWVAGRLVFILGGVVIGFTWGMAKRAGAVTVNEPKGNPRDKATHESTGSSHVSP